MFSYLRVEDYVPKDHPLRPIREIVNAALREMDETFAAMYAESGRDSIAPERLLRGLILQSLYGLRSERLLCEQLGYNMLFRWFVGLDVERKRWDHSTYTKNRDRLIEHEVVRELFEQVLDQAKAKGLLSSEHFSVDGTLIRAWASHKSFVPKDGAPPPSSGSRGNPEVDFKGQKRTNDTHASKSDPEAKLATKSPKIGAIPAYLGHVLSENRNGLVVDTRLSEANGFADVTCRHKGAGVFRHIGATFGGGNGHPGGSRMRGLCAVGNLRPGRRRPELRGAIGLSVEHQAVGVVAQPIEGRRGEQPIGGEGLIPFAEVEVGSDDGRGGLVALGD
jgi:transposase